MSCCSSHKDYCSLGSFQGAPFILSLALDPLNYSWIRVNYSWMCMRLCMPVSEVWWDLGPCLFGDEFWSCMIRDWSNHKKKKEELIEIISIGR